MELRFNKPQFNEVLIDIANNVIGVCVMGDLWGGGLYECILRISLL